MFEIFNIPDISQLMLKRQLRNNNSLLFFINGVDNLEESLEFLKKYSLKCSMIFYNKKIEKPTYEETQEIIQRIFALDSFSYENVFRDINFILPSMTEKNKKLLSDAVYNLFVEIQQINTNASVIRNGYIRSLVSLKARFPNIMTDLSQEHKILYVGKPDKFDILVFTILGLCGVDVVICDLNNDTKIECICKNRFVTINGVIRSGIELSFLTYIDKGVKDIEYKTIIANDWAHLKDYSTLEDYLKVMNFKYKDRFEHDKWKVLRIKINGVDDPIGYSTSLDNFKVSTVAMGRKTILFDGVIPNASYEENEKYIKEYSKLSMFDAFSRFPIFENSGLPIYLETYFKEIESKSNLSSSKLTNYITVLKIWLFRYLELFFNTTTLESIPLLIVYSDLSEKELDCLQLLNLLPIDIIYFHPNANNKSSNIENFISVVIGMTCNELAKYPSHTGVNKVATLAYSTERELDTILYSDTSLYRIKQFKNINPIVLKTTYEEVSILWDEPAKMRPSFESAGNLVTVPTIFTKVNGVNEKYIEDIKRLCGKNTLFFDSFPIQMQPSIIDNGAILRDFVKQLVFKDSIDFEKLKKSKYYSYNVYSEETQELIQDKVLKLTQLDWCNNAEKTLIYDVLDTVYRLPNSILQMIHNYDFTAEIPKIVIYNGSNTPCTLSDCILIMFLKLIGFDIVVFAPTGYRIIEQYINSQWYNEITIGQFDFSLPKIDLSVSSNNKKKQSFFSRLFN